MGKLTEITKPKLLVGEGIEEEQLFRELIKNILPNNSDILITSYGGKYNLAKFLKALPLIPNFQELESLGITRDADNSIQSAFDSVCSALKNNNLPAPRKLNNPTAINNNLKVSIFFLPDNQKEGMLEDLCLQSVEDDLGMSCVDSYFECINNKARRQPKNMAKARLHAWLASKKISDKRLGEAAKAGYWDFENSAFNKLKNFILSL